MYFESPAVFDDPVRWDRAHDKVFDDLGSVVFCLFVCLLLFFIVCLLFFWFLYYWSTLFLPKMSVFV